MRSCGYCCRRQSLGLMPYAWRKARLAWAASLNRHPDRGAEGPAPTVIMAHGFTATREI